MGHGSWTSTSYNTYTTTTRGVSADTFASATNYTAQSVYTSYHLDPMLNPKGVTRSCRDTDEHPATVPVILALDVTGSMGGASVKVAQKLNEIMTTLYDTVKDVEFCIMGIGDIAYDDAPIQISQFESDVRIAEQLDKIYFEGGGGGNKYESYTAAWYMGARHCDLDCWKRGQKGIIITLGDEAPNPYLEASRLSRVVGDTLQSSIETKDLLAEVTEKFNVYHISVEDRESSYTYYNAYLKLDDKWKELLGEDNYFVANLDNLPNTIINIIQNQNSFILEAKAEAGIQVNDNGEVTW